MGVLVPRLHTLDRSPRPPIDTSGNFPAHMSAVTFKHLPQPLRSQIRSFGTLGQLFKIHPFLPEYVIVRGVGGVPNYFFVDWNAHIF